MLQRDQTLNSILPSLLSLKARLFRISSLEMQQAFLRVTFRSSNLRADLTGFDIGKSLHELLA